MNGHTPPHVTPIILLLGQNAEIHFNERVNKISLGGNASSTTYIGVVCIKNIYIYISSDWYNQIPNYSLMILTHFLFYFKIFELQESERMKMILTHIYQHSRLLTSK